MRVVVLGAGALGSILAGHLARAGQDVTLIARGDRADYLRQNGITITGIADFNTPCSLTTDPGELSGADVLIVAVKTYQMEEALSSVAHVKFASVLSVQNGVKANEQLFEVFGPETTLGATASFSGETLPDGQVRFTVNAGFHIGELPEGRSTRAQDIATMLQRSGINTEAVDNVQSEQWSKFVMWSGATSVGLLTRLATYRFLSDPDSALILARIMREVGAIAVHQGIPLVKSGPFPVDAIVNGSEDTGVAALNEIGALFEKSAPNHRMSALQDLDNGRRLEIDETLGFAVSEARRLGIPAPTLEMCYGLVSGINRNL